MSDIQRRASERRAAASGSQEEELAALRARLRAGARLDGPAYFRLAELSIEAAAELLSSRLGCAELRAAAWCGHAPAERRLGMRVTGRSDAEWFRGWSRLGGVWFDRAFLALGLALRPAVAREFGASPWSEAVAAAFEAGLAHLRAPEDESRRQLEAAQAASLTRLWGLGSLRSSQRHLIALFDRLLQPANRVGAREDAAQRASLLVALAATERFVSLAEARRVAAERLLREALALR